MTVLALPRDVVRVRPRQSLLAHREAAVREAAADHEAETRRNERLESMFPLARQIIDARCHAARAALVLRFSDEIVLGHFASLSTACDEVGFADGQQYLLERYAGLLAVRDEFGLQRDLGRLELFRRGLVALAQGARP